MKSIRKYSVIILLLCTLVMLISAVFSTALGSVALLKMGLPSYNGTKGFSSRLLIALAMPAFSGNFGSYNSLIKDDFNSFINLKKAKSIVGEESEDYAEILSSLVPNETFAQTDGLPVSTVNMHPQSDNDSYEIIGNIFFKNQSQRDLDVAQTLESASPITFENTDEPLVLIYHTHTSESYNTTGESYTDSSLTHTPDNNLNIAAVGQTLADSLAALGINSVQCTDRLDASYSTAYDMSEQTVKEYLEKYPSIQIVIDMHRDAVIDDNGTMYRPVTTVRGMDVAQVLVIVGRGGEDYPDNPYFADNLNYGISLTQALEDCCPGITRSLLVKCSDFNQRFHENSILVEMGTCGNTLTEAKRSAVFLAAAIAQTVYQNQG